MALSEVEKLYRQLTYGTISDADGRVSSVDALYRQLLSQPIDSLLFGTDKHTGRDYHLPLSEWKTGMHILGPPGSGKTMLLFVIVTQLLAQGKTVVMCDPLRPLYELLTRWLSWQSPELQARVILSDPGHTYDYYFGLNACQKLDESFDTAVCSMGLVDVVARSLSTDPNEAPAMTKSLLDFSDPLFTDPSLTIAELPLMATLGKSLERRNLAHLASSPEITQEILALDRAPLREQEMIIGSLNRRLPRLLRPKAMQSILGRTTRTFNFDQLEEGTSFLGYFGDSPGVLSQRHGEVNCSLFLNDLCAWLRTRSPADAALHPIYILIDEFFLVAPDGMAQQMDTLRNFGARWCLSHQRLGQLITRDPDLLSAVITDCRMRFVFGGLTQADLEIMAPLMSLGTLDLKTIKNVIEMPTVTGYQDRRVINHSTADAVAESSGFGGGSNSARGSAGSFGMIDGGFFAGPELSDERFSNSDSSGSSDNWVETSSSSHMTAATESLMLQPIIEWLKTNITYYSKDDLQYLVMAELYQQDPANVTFRNLTGPRVSLKVLHREAPPLRQHRMEPFIDRVLTTQAHVFERQPDTLAAIRDRHKGLQAPPARTGIKNRVDQE